MRKSSETPKDNLREKGVTRKLEEKFGETRRELGKQKEVTRKLEEKFGDTKRELRAKYGETKRELEAKYGETKRELEAKFGETKRELEAKFRETKRELGGKVRGNQKGTWEAIRGSCTWIMLITFSYSVISAWIYLSRLCSSDLYFKASYSAVVSLSSFSDAVTRADHISSMCHSQSLICCWICAMCALTLTFFLITYVY